MFRVAYSTSHAFRNSYLYDISMGGLFIESADPPNPGETIRVKIFLPDEEKEMDVLGEVVWSTRVERVTSERKYPPGMGVKFLNLSNEERIKISINILKGYR